MLVFEVPPEFRDCLQGEAPGAALCHRCLSFRPVEEPPAELPDFDEISEDSFPDDPDAAVPMAIALGLLSSLAIYRAEIERLLAAVEEAGVDPLLVLDRLARMPTIDGDVDLLDRKAHLEQLLQ
jgi:hypothetical protein